MNSPLQTMILIIIIVLAVALTVSCDDDSTDNTLPPEPAASPSPPTTAPSQQQAPAPSTDTAVGSIPKSEPIEVVTSINIVADWVRRVGGDRVDVFPLLPPNADPHTFQPGARDTARVADADLVLTVGLGLESGWLSELIENAARDHESIIELGDAVDPIAFVEMEGRHEAEGEDKVDEDEDHAAVAGRLLVSHASEAHLSVVDLMSGETSVGEFDIAAADASLYSSPGYRFGFALARGDGDDDDRVHVFDGGIYLVPHAGHADLASGAISKLAIETTDERPIHFANAYGWTAIFNDGSGRVALFEEHEMEEFGDEYNVQFLDAGPHHGAAIPMAGDLFAISIPSPDERNSLPVGVEVRDLDDRVLYGDASSSCPGMHGEARNHDGAMFGCEGGVLFIEFHDGQFDHWFIDNPGEMREESRIGTVWGHEDAAHFFGSASYHDGDRFVYDGIWMIDIEGRAMVQVLAPEEGKRSAGAAFSADGHEFFVLTYDGLLNVIATETGEVEETSPEPLAAPVDAEAVPSFVVVGEMLYLADRAAERVIEFSLADMETEREWNIGSVPSGIAFLGIAGGEDDDHPEEGHDHGPLDPHFWFDPQRVKLAVHEIANRLTVMDPAGAGLYRANAHSYSSELDELHHWIIEQVATIPTDRRLLVTSHDSFQYFATTYEFEVVAAVFPGGTTEREPSAKEIAELIDEIDEAGAPAVFTETSVSDTLAARIADEVGASIINGLYTGSLSDAGGDAGTYIDLMRYNVATIVEALR